MIKDLCKGISPAVCEAWSDFTCEHSIPEEQTAFHIEKALLRYVEEYRLANNTNRIYGDLGTPNLSSERLISPLGKSDQRPCEGLSDAVLVLWEQFLLEYGELNYTFHTEKALMTYIGSYRRKVSKMIKLSVFRDSEETQIAIEEEIS
ncbi:MAG: hypothetical protein ACE5OZ_21005 [Candidatus Heimdallarchaeota archaeon]